jgi:alpha-ketoglutarate-dependent taurine dioxygenase
MKITKIPGFGNYGQYIDDLDFNTITDEEWAEIGRSHLKNLLTIFRNTNITKDQYISRITQFGPLKSSIRGYFKKKYGRIPDSLDPASLEGIDEQDKIFFESKKYMLEETEGGNFLTRVTGAKDKDGHMLGFFDSGDLGWHSNESSQITFSPEVALLGSENMIGSATGFVQTADYYESVSDSFRSELDEMVMVHSFTPGKINAAELTDAGMRRQIQLSFCPVNGAEVPLVVTSPGGIRGLHYTINTADHIKGMTKEQSNRIFKQIDDALFTDQYTYYHHYQHNNDLVLFDNSITLHSRVGGAPDRKAYRFQYDPSRLLDAAWHPYDAGPYRDFYVSETQELVKLMSLPNFKVPV